MTPKTATAWRRRGTEVFGTTRALLLVLAVAGLAVACVGEEPTQPLAFNHALHVQKHAIECTSCHPGALRGTRAGLPPLAKCLSCHMKPQGERPSDAEAMVRQIATSDAPFRWVQVTRNPGHVYFSHRVHTTFADMRCQLCHGHVEQWTEPPTKPNPALVDMNRCMSCHRNRGVSNECRTCHR